MQNKPIGIFDSGVGGTSIFKEIHQLLPHENTIYLADSLYAPYGEKSQAQIIELSIKNTEILLKENCKLVVVACNTATTNSIDYLRANYRIPFIGIEPAIKPAALQTKTKAVGILATKGTLASELFHKTTNLYGSDIKVIEQEGNGIVELIEAGKTDSDEMLSLLREYISPMVEAKIDHLVLGCTHYPYLILMLRKLLPDHVKIIDSGEAVARQTKAILAKHNLLSDTIENGTCRFYTNGKLEVLKNLVPNECSVEKLDF